MQKQFDKSSYHSNNMYQLLTYIKNKEVETRGEVAGVLLYAKTQESVVPDQNFKLLGNSFSLRTLDLNTDFGIIKQQLDSLAYTNFNEDILIQ